LIVVFVKNILESIGYKLKNINTLKFRSVLQKIIVKTTKYNVFLIFYSIFVAGAVTGVLKVLIGRARPVFFEALGQTGFVPGTNDWAFNSMPSGHTSASFAGLVMVGLLFPKYKWATWTLAILIGLSRIAMGAHFPSDVILGAFIGMAVADLVKWFFCKKVK